MPAPQQYQSQGKKRVKVMVHIYSLVSSTKRHPPNFTQLPPGHRTCSFMNKPSQLPSCRFWRTELFKHTSLHRPTRYLPTPGLRECTREQSALPRSTMSEHIQRSQGSSSQSLACTSHMLPWSYDAPHSRRIGRLN